MNTLYQTMERCEVLGERVVFAVHPGGLEDGHDHVHPPLEIHLGCNQHVSNSYHPTQLIGNMPTETT